MGLDKIRAKAHRDRTDRDEQGGERFSGYYAWPRMGFDGDIPGTVLGKLRASKLPEPLRTAKNVATLMRTKQGRKWWKEHGDSIEVGFDLRPGSTHLKVLNRYIKEIYPQEVGG